MVERTHDEIIAQDDLDEALRAYASHLVTRKAFARVAELNRIRNIRLVAERYERTIKEAMKLTGE